ncbi:fluoride efflux transporter CrcB, partial [Klebsiella pneumoniae]
CLKIQPATGSFARNLIYSTKPLGAFIIGAAMAYFMRHPQLDPAWKLLIVTGLCGGLTTFSTFSVEVFTLLQTGNYLWALTSVLVHVTGSLLMTAAGFYLITLLI